MESVNKLANLLQRRIKQISDKPSNLDFGTIEEDLSLNLNSIPTPIPEGQYLSCIRQRPGDTVVAGFIGGQAVLLAELRS